MGEMIFGLGGVGTYFSVHYVVVLYGSGLLTYDIKETNFRVAYETPTIRYECHGKSGELFLTGFDPHVMASDTEGTISYLERAILPEYPYFPWPDNMPANCSTSPRTPVLTNENVYTFEHMINEKTEGAKLLALDIQASQKVL